MIRNLLGATAILGMVSWAIVCTEAQSTGWRCFTCTAQSNNDLCVTDPGKVSNPTVNCDMNNDQGFGWCYIVRQEYTAIPGEVVSFFRTCLKTEPAIKDDVISDSESTFYYRSCRTHLCNSGSGLESLGPGGGSGGGGSGGNNPITVRPEGDAAMAISASTLTIAILTATLFLLGYHF